MAPEGNRLVSAERECYCGAAIRPFDVTIDGVRVRGWTGTTVNQPYEESTLCYPGAPGRDGEAHHEPADGEEVET